MRVYNAITTYMGHIYHLWLLTNWNWMISNLQFSSPCTPTNSTSLWHLIKIMTDPVCLLVHFIYLTSIPFQNARKSKLLSWIADVEYILHNERNKTIWLNRQYTPAYFKKLHTNQFLDLHTSLQTPSMRWNRLLRLPCGEGKMGCVRRHIWAWGGSFSMKKGRNFKRSSPYHSIRSKNLVFWPCSVCSWHSLPCIHENPALLPCCVVTSFNMAIFDFKSCHVRFWFDAYYLTRFLFCKAPIRKLSS